MTNCYRAVEVINAGVVFLLLVVEMLEVTSVRNREDCKLLIGLMLDSSSIK